MKVVFTCACFLLLIVSSCRKDSTGDGNGNNGAGFNCRITEASFTGINSYKFIYNEDGKLSEAHSGDTSISYSYTPGSTVVTTLYAGVFHTKITVLLNNEHKVTNTRIDYNTAGTSWQNYDYQYENNLISKTVLKAAGTSNSVTSVFQWQNGNIKSVTSTNTSGNTHTTLFNYYTDKPKLVGDYISFVELLQGYHIYTNKNLIKSIDDTRYVYDFAADGNISSLKVINAGGELFSGHYQYECK